MPADLNFPSDVAAIRCSLTVGNPGTVTGRSSDLGIQIASYNPPFTLRRGQRFWSGEFEIAPTDKGNEEHRGIIEALIVDYLQGNQSVHIPVSRSSLVTFNQTPVGAMMTDSNNTMTFQSASITEINFKKGTYFTVEDKLYIYKGSNKNVKSVGILAGDTFPPYPAMQKTGVGVEYLNPYLLGILPQDQTVLMDREGTFAGPWIIPFVSVNE